MVKITREKIQKSLKDITAIKKRLTVISTKLFDLEKRLAHTESLAVRNLKHPLDRKIKNSVNSKI